MKRIIYFVILLLSISILAGTGISCNKNMFDEAMYDTLIKIQSPVDSVDPNHKWELSTSKYIIVTANAGTGTRQVQIFDENPVSSESAKIITQVDMVEGDRIGLSISYPSLSPKRSCLSIMLFATSRSILSQAIMITMT